MKSRYVFCVFLCLVIRFSSGFGVDDTDTGTAVQFLLKEFQSLRNRVSVLESFVEKQTEIIQVQNDRIVKLEAIVKSGSFNEDDLKKSNYSLGDIEDGAHRSRNNYTETNPLEIDRQNTSASFIQSNAQQERKQKRGVRLAVVQPIAFYAYMSSALNNPGGHHTLVFDVTKTNEGSGYHAHLGVFMVPKSGTYFFSWTMSLDSSSYHGTELVVNNQVHGAIYLDTSSSGRDCVTGNLILQLNEQDEVFIRTRDAYNGGQIYSDAYSRTSFSGFLIV
ncbi:uncharacterized protein LOC125662786 [Ostrea edulis]|uniref:uncharacterized protein LOC125662786 n=1 Tax=Ostrea edulis TaxID=37623 RepID=UPI0024AFD547|nr:uncharacterized protein LOC125662786 [Ostrea edulis]